MKTLKVLLQEVVSGIKAWVNSNFAQESNTVHKTGNETVNGDKYLTGYIRHTLTYDCIQSTAFDVRTDPEANRGRDIFRFWDGDRSSLGNYLGGMSYYQQTDGSSRLQLICFGYPTTGDAYQRRINFHAYRDGSASFYPVYGSDYINLGTSTNQWKSVYAKNYFYNGTAWGLDKANVWTQSNRFNGSVYSKAQARAFKLGGFPDDAFTVQPQSTFFSEIHFVDKNETTQSYIAFQHRADATETHRICFRVCRTQGDHYVSVNLNSNDELYPERNNAIDLGTSNKKWKTLNGVNPGALSFPNYSDTTYIDISGSIVPPTGETEINKNLGTNYYTPPVDGWLSIRCDGAQYLQIYRNTYNCPGVTAGDGTAGIKLVVTLPVRKNETYTIRIKKEGAGIENYQLYPCLGNV